MNMTIFLDQASVSAKFHFNMDVYIYKSGAERIMRNESVISSSVSCRPITCPKLALASFQLLATADNRLILSVYCTKIASRKTTNKRRRKNATQLPPMMYI